MDSRKANELVSQTVLHEVQTSCQLPHHLEPQTNSCLKKCVDELSLFAGRNPIVIANLESKMSVQKSPSASTVDGLPQKTSSHAVATKCTQTSYLHVTPRIAAGIAVIAYSRRLRWYDGGTTVRDY